jgi:hypothetical protein
MSKTKKTLEPKPRARPEKRLREARKSLERLQADIAPFAARRRFRPKSGASEWCETSSLYP